MISSSLSTYHHHYQHITNISKYFLCKGVRSDSVGESHCQSKGESETTLIMMILTFIDYSDGVDGSHNNEDDGVIKRVMTMLLIEQ